MVDIEWVLVNIVGNIGVALILIAYSTLTLKLISSESIRYSLLNLCGAISIGVSLIFEFNLPAAVIEVCWTIISLFGLSKALLRRYRTKNNNNDNNETASEKSSQTCSSQHDTTPEPTAQPELAQNQPPHIITETERQVEHANIV